MFVVSSHVDLFAIEPRPRTGTTLEVLVSSCPACVSARFPHLQSYKQADCSSYNSPRRIESRTIRQLRRRLDTSKHISILFLQINTLLPINRAPIRQLERAVTRETYSFPFFLRHVDNAHAEAFAIAHILDFVDKGKVAAAQLREVACGALP